LERHGRLHYQPFYCEENAWWLCADPALGPGEPQVVFITSLAGRVPMLGQRAAPPGRLILWDYHVVVADGAGRIWDLDSRLPIPAAGLDWLAKTFALANRLPPAYGPCLRLVPAKSYRRDFASDRSHMRDSKGRWRHPPPPWPPIGCGMTLPMYLNPEAPGPDRLLDLAEVQVWLGSASALSVP
jgi:protein N-terminal glutamine amidohydrolase